jgi:hypothetical protein
MTASATAIAIGVLVATQGSAALANVWMTAAAGSCTRSATPVVFDPATACSSLDAAYQVAALGDSVLVRGGAYGCGSITDEASKDTSGDAANVVFQEAPGETATFTDLTLGTSVNGGDGPDHLSLIGFSDGGAGSCNGLPDEIFVGGDDANDILIENWDGGSFYVNGAQLLTIKGGDWGPCPDMDYTNDLCNNSKIDGNTLNADIVLDGITLHDYTFGPNCLDYVGGTQDCHEEGLFLSNTGPRFVVKNSRFYNNFIYNVFIQPSGTYDMVFENNWFGRARQVTPGSTYPASAPRNGGLVTAGASVSNILVRFNSFATDQSLVNEDTIGTNFRAVGNIFGVNGSSNCIGGITYNFNVWIAGSCGSNSTAQTPLPYVNLDDQGAGDYHLAGAESQAPDNFVTTTTGDFALTTDYDAQARPQDSTTRDAGSDER